MRLLARPKTSRVTKKSEEEEEDIPTKAPSVREIKEANDIATFYQYINQILLQISMKLFQILSYGNWIVFVMGQIQRGVLNFYVL